MYTNNEILILLNSIGLTNRSVNIIIENIKDLNILFQYKNKDLLNKLHPNQRIKLNGGLNKGQLDTLLEKLKASRIDILSIYDNDYPKLLTEIHDRPYLLYKKGNFELERDSLSISIVGSRNPTAYGRWACHKIVKELSKYNITIISGLAAGIDRIAHKTALKYGSRTIGVLGNGLDIVYPLCNKDLYEDIQNNGCILTEYSLNTKPFHYNFPRRNRIISGLSLGTIVVEAKEKSGSLITAHSALEQGKEVFAVPGNINSQYSKGTNKLIKDGAIPLLEIENLFDEILTLNKNIEKKKLEKIDYSNLSKMERIIVDSLLEGPKHCDIISQKTNLDISTTLSVLTILEMKDIVIEISSKVFGLC